MAPQSTQRRRQRERDFTAEHAEDAERKAEAGRERRAEKREESDQKTKGQGL